jgi:hypothetical protein
MVPLIAFICVLEPVLQRKKFYNTKKQLFFLLKKIILKQCPNPNPNFFRIRLKLTDSFGFGSTTLLLRTGIHAFRTGTSSFYV